MAARLALCFILGALSAGMALARAKVNMTFENPFDKPMQMYFLGPDGREDYKGEAPPKSTIEMACFHGHVFAFEQDGTFLDFHTVDSLAGTDQRVLVNPNIITMEFDNVGQEPIDVFHLTPTGKESKGTVPPRSVSVSTCLNGDTISFEKGGMEFMRHTVEKSFGRRQHRVLDPKSVSVDFHNTSPSAVEGFHVEENGELKKVDDLASYAKIRHSTFDGHTFVFKRSGREVARHSVLRSNGPTQTIQIF